MIDSFVSLTWEGSGTLDVLTADGTDVVITEDIVGRCRRGVAHRRMHEIERPHCRLRQYEEILARWIEKG